MENLVLILIGLLALAFIYKLVRRSSQKGGCAGCGGCSSCHTDDDSCHHQDIPR